jgi:hypothetical protein
MLRVCDFVHLHQALFCIVHYWVFMVSVDDSMERNELYLTFGSEILDTSYFAARRRSPAFGKMCLDIHVPTPLACSNLHTLDIMVNLGDC